MAPFIYSEVKSVIKSFFWAFVKPIIKKSKTATDLRDIYLSREENLLPIKDVEMEFEVKKELKELIRNDNVSAKDMRKFCEHSRSVTCGIVIKLFERSLILCKIVRFTTVFDPVVFLRWRETHNALQLPVFFFPFFSFFSQPYLEYREIRSKKIFYRPSNS